MSEAMYEVPGSRLREMTESITSLTEQLAAAQAIIAEALECLEENEDRDEVAIRILSQSPTDALQAHDRQVAAKALTDAADDIYSMGGTAGFLFPAVRDLLRARAASLVPGNPEPTEGQS